MPHAAAFSVGGLVLNLFGVLLLFRYGIALPGRYRGLLFPAAACAVKPFGICRRALAGARPF
jgi:hypothetical protein